MLQTVFMIVAFYWFFIALTLFLLVALEIYMENYPWYKYVVHGIGLGAPISFAIIIFSAGAYEFSGGGNLTPHLILSSLSFNCISTNAGWCNPQSAHHHAYDLALSWGWVLLFLLLIFAFAVGVFMKILRVNLLSGLFSSIANCSFDYYRFKPLYRRPSGSTGDTLECLFSC